MSRETDELHPMDTRTFSGIKGLYKHEPGPTDFVFADCRSVLV